MIISQRTSLLAFVTALLITAIPALAQPAPEAMARRCIAEIRGIARAAAGEIDQSTQRGIAGMVRADRNGASDEDLTAAADRTKGRIGNLAERASNRIETLSAACVARLTEVGADPELIDQVSAAAAAAGENLSGKAERAQGRVDAALARLLG